MKKVLKILAILALISLIIIQFIRPDFTNSPVVESETLESSDEMSVNAVTILSRSCYDCHSNQTAYPWYSKIQPSAWFLADHIKEGRKELNFSVWNTYPTNRKRRKLDEICEQVKARQMPLPSYLWMHRNASLSEAEINTLCEWTTSQSERLASGQQ